MLVFIAFLCRVQETRKPENLAVFGFVVITPGSVAAPGLVSCANRLDAANRLQS
jgi:hypothetical protein